MKVDRKHFPEKGEEIIDFEHKGKLYRIIKTEKQVSIHVGTHHTDEFFAHAGLDESRVTMGMHSINAEGAVVSDVNRTISLYPSTYFTDLKPGEDTVKVTRVDLRNGGKSFDIEVVNDKLYEFCRKSFLAATEGDFNKAPDFFGYLLELFFNHHDRYFNESSVPVRAMSQEESEADWSHHATGYHYWSAQAFQKWVLGDFTKEQAAVMYRQYLKSNGITDDDRSANRLMAKNLDHVRELLLQESNSIKETDFVTDTCVIDGSNVAWSIGPEDGKAHVRWLEMTIEHAKRDWKRTLVIADASLPHQIDDPRRLKVMIDDGTVRLAPAGSQADHFILSEADRLGAIVLTGGERYQDRTDMFSWLKDGNRVLPVMLNADGSGVIIYKSGKPKPALQT